MHAIRRAGEAEAADFVAGAAGVEHPVGAVGGPHGGFAEAVFIECAVGAELEDRIGAQLCPGDAVVRARDADALPPRAVLSEIEHVQIAAGLDNIRIADAAFVPAHERTWREHRIAVPLPYAAVRRLREPDMLWATGLIVVEQRAPAFDDSAIRGDVAAFPCCRIGCEDFTLLLPREAVIGGRETRRPCFPIEARI